MQNARHQNTESTGPMKTFSLIRSVALAYGLAATTALPAGAQITSLGPLVELSQPYALAGCNDGFQPPGTMTLNDAGEPFVAVNPAYPNNMVAAWIAGNFQNVMSAASFDGGQ